MAVATNTFLFENRTTDGNGTDATLNGGQYIIGVFGPNATGSSVVTIELSPDGGTETSGVFGKLKEGAGSGTTVSFTGFGGALNAQFKRFEFGPQGYKIRAVLATSNGQPVNVRIDQ